MQGLNQRPKAKIPVVGTGSLNLAEFASEIDQKDFDLNIPLTFPGSSSVDPSLSLSVCAILHLLSIDFFDSKLTHGICCFCTVCHSGY